MTSNASNNIPQNEFLNLNADGTITLKIIIDRILYIKWLNVNYSYVYIYL